MPFAAVPEEMPWDEAVGLARLLRQDPSSWVSAALEGWEFPISRETAAVLDLFDLEHIKASKRPPEPHGGRPWSKPKRTQRYGSTGGRTHEQVRAILRAHGHDI